MLKIMNQTLVSIELTRAAAFAIRIAAIALLI